VKYFVKKKCFALSFFKIKPTWYFDIKCKEFLTCLVWLNNINTFWGYCIILYIYIA